MSRFDIHLGDVVAWCDAYEGELHHACITDPPYHLTEPNSARSSYSNRMAQGRTVADKEARSKGFMGKAWDGGDVAFQPETWAAIARVLHPGAFVMAFASSRGWHRMAVAMEDAGLIIHPSIFGWCYGSGFPKATRLDVQIDRKAGAQRRVVGRRKHAPKFDAKGHGYRQKDNGYNSRERVDFEETAPATDLAAAWVGHRYGLQALKPALEPIIVAQKPYQGRPVDSITRTGAGALWVDGARLPTADDLNGGSYGNTSRDDDAFFARKRPGGAGDFVQPSGRWPANFYLSHHPACGDTCHPDCPVERIGQQSGMAKSHHGNGGINRRKERNGYEGGWGDGYSAGYIGESGTAARYFFNSDYALDALEAADPVLYAAKASKAEREAGLLPSQRARMAELYGDDEADEFDDIEPGRINDGKQAVSDRPYLRNQTERYNTHPTIKSLAVARWLATLLLPPDLYAPRRLFVPFSGAGSEMIGALLAGWEYVQGVELMADHVAIAHARAEWWINRPEMEREQARTAMTRPISGKSTAGLTPLERMIAGLKP